MKRLLGLAGIGAGLVGVCLAAQPPQRELQTQDRNDRRDGRREDGGPAGGPPRWRLGLLLPPPVLHELNLSDEQQQQLKDLEKETRKRVLSLLTDEQRKKALQLEKRGFGRPGRGPGSDDGDRGGPPDNDRRGPPGNDRRPPRDRGKPPDDDRPPEPPGMDLSVARENSRTKVGIQWFASLESGLREAKRSGRPILLVSGAPHCAGVPGVW
jgi:hypothetical protein